MAKTGGGGEVGHERKGEVALIYPLVSLTPK